VRWQNLCKALGADELLANPRYATVDDRERHVEELRQVIQDRLGKFNCKDGIALLAGANIPIARVRTLPEVMQDEHFRDRGTLKPMYRQDSDEPVERGIVAGFPVTFSSGPLPQLEGGAKLGHHNEEVYGRLLDLDAAALAELKERGIL
jgi:crotonobetainyl-CoA:carnitine CoA-transferase CaiB-like acyl-CoA transferase